MACSITVFQGHVFMIGYVDFVDEYRNICASSIWFFVVNLYLFDSVKSKLVIGDKCG